MTCILKAIKQFIEKELPNFTTEEFSQNRLFSFFSTRFKEEISSKVVSDPKPNGLILEKNQKDQ